MRRVALLLFMSAWTAIAGPSGVVINQTTGEPEPRIPVTLISFAQGMDPVEEVFTDAEGRFEFSRDVPGMGMVRTEHQGVSYTTMLRPDAMEAVQVPIYEAKATPALAPTTRILIFEPGEAEMVVNESYLFLNETDATFRDADRGSLRFYLPPEARGVVQVEASGPARMPLRATAEPSDEENIYKVDFPIKPGENRLSLSYLLPHQGGESEFVGKSPYPDLQTRIAAPPGVEITGENLQSFGTEPSTQTSIYEAPGGDDFRVTITGQGRLPRREAEQPAAGGGSPNEISIEPPPIAREAVWVIGISSAILALGFFLLLTHRKE